MTSRSECRLGPDGCLEPRTVGPVDRESTPPRGEWVEVGGAGRKLGQQRGSAAALNDYTGLNLLGRGQAGSGRLSDSEKRKNASDEACSGVVNVR